MIDAIAENGSQVGAHSKENTMHISRSGLISALATATFLVAAFAHAQDADTPTIADKSGCKVYNPMPQENESIKWSGKCVNGYADGPGTLDWYINGQLEERYEGDLSSGWADGEGTYVSKRGMRYKGQWKKSMQHGKGTVQNPDGSVYEGDWKEGKPHGWGVYRAPGGETVEGEWENGELKSESSSRRI